MKLTEIKYVDHLGEERRISVEQQETLIKLALETCIYSGNLHLGSVTEREMYELYTCLKWKKYMAEIGKSYNELTENDREEIALMEARDNGYEV